MDCKGIEKVVPVSTMAESSSIWHMTDFKLHTRGKGVTPLDEIVEKLEGQREEGKGKGHTFDEKTATLVREY